MNSINEVPHAIPLQRSRFGAASATSVHSTRPLSIPPSGSNLNLNALAVLSLGMGDLNHLAPGIQSDNPAEQLSATVALRTLLYIDEHREANIQRVIDTGSIVERLVQFLGHSYEPSLQVEAAGIITNLAAGSSDQCAHLVQCGVIPVLCDLLRTTNSSSSENTGTGGRVDVVSSASSVSAVHEEVCWALANIAGDSTQHRDDVLNAGVLEPLLDIIDCESTNTEVLSVAVGGLLSNLCRDWTLKMLTGPYQLIITAIPTLLRLLDRDTIDPDTISAACWSIGNLQLAPAAVRQALDHSGARSRLVQLLDHPSKKCKCRVARHSGGLYMRQARVLTRRQYQNATAPRLWKTGHHRNPVSCPILCIRCS